MPIEVRELVIKAVVEQEGGRTVFGGARNSSTDNSVSPQEETIKMCVEKVLEILEERNER